MSTILNKLLVAIVIGVPSYQCALNRILTITISMQLTNCEIELQTQIIRLLIVL